MIRQKGDTSTLITIKTLLIVVQVVCLNLPVYSQIKPNYEDADPIISQLDSLNKLWFLKQTGNIRNKKSVNTYGFRPNEVPEYSDSVYAERIRLLAKNSPLPYTYNEYVKGFIELYAFRKRDLVEKMLGLSEYYFPITEEIMDRYDIPLELKYLSVVESALNTHAVSPMKATGLWQFMYSTGRMYRLQITSYVDERQDPYKSTQAAARYLRDLHNSLFNDWFLALAAYNCGPGNVIKAIRKSGGKKTFWEIYRFLPKETRGYVPAFIAASYVFHYHKEHNLFPQNIGLPLHVDTIHVNQELNFESITKYVNVSTDLLKELNPQFKKGYIPAEEKQGFTLRLPAIEVGNFTLNKDTIIQYYASNFINGREKTRTTNLNTYNTQDSKKQDSSTQTENRTVESKEDVEVTWVYYTVKPNERLSQIANWFDVSIQEIVDWNHLNSEKIGSGRKLKISVPSDKKSYYAKINRMTVAQKKYLRFSETEAKPIAKKKTKIKPSKIAYYVVQKGDTLWSISQKFPGVSVEDIKKANRLVGSNSIRVGQTIKIVKG